MNTTARILALGVLGVAGFAAYRLLYRGTIGLYELEAISFALPFG